MNSLKHLDEFQTLLANYRRTPESADLLNRSQLVLLVGPTSSGKNTLIAELLKTGHYHPIVSDTTRAPRENDGVMEQNGREYWFRSEEDVLTDVRSGRFLEAAVIHGQQVSGINLRELETATGQRKCAINEVDVVGAAHIHELKPDAYFLFILPPSFDEWMARMTARGPLPADEIHRRLQSAIKELETALQADFYRFVVNDTTIQTAQRIDQLIQTGQGTEDENLNGRSLAETLLQDTKIHLG